MNEQQKRALNLFGGETQMLKTVEELAELIQPISKAIAEIRRTGDINRKTLWSIKKELYDVKFMLPQLEAVLASYDENLAYDMAAIKAAEVKRMEERLKEVK